MKKIHIKDIGLVSIAKNKRSKTLRATLQPDNTYRVTIPRYATYREAINFLNRKKSKLLEMQKNYREKVQGYEKYEPGKIYNTKFHKYHLDYHDQKDIMVKPVAKNRLKILIPRCDNISDDEMQYFLRQIVRDIYRHEAKGYLIPRAIMYAKKHNLQFNRITIKNAKSRWGSCSSKKNVNLNLNLMRLPDDLIDYVVLHELAHLKHQNHSADFWQFLAEMIENPKQLDKKLKEYALLYFAT